MKKYSKYKTHAYCSSCGSWIKKTELLRNDAGDLLCPNCYRRVRVKPRKPGK